MNKWWLLYDDGATPKIHMMQVEGETLVEAVVASGLNANAIWAAVLDGHTTAASIYFENV